MLALVIAAAITAPGSPLDRARWPASWITAAGAPERDPVVLHFRKALTLAAAPTRFVVRVSADNRFLLHVNGQRVGAGPARGDLEHWRYQTYDLAPFLRAGKNLIAATVWNFGLKAPIAQISRQTGFILQGEDAAAANTDPSWEAAIESGHAVLPASADAIVKRGFYYAAGPGERRDATTFDWDWDGPASKSPAWQRAVSLMTGNPRAIRDGSPSQLSPKGWMLVRDPLPPMEHTSIPTGRVVRVDPSVRAEPGFPANGRAVFPARAKTRLLLDRRELTNAYPEIAVSGGRGAVLRVTYSEALVGPDGLKGNRDEIEGKEMTGLYDELVADGQSRIFSPLWWRAWRYLELEATTGDEPLVVERVGAHFTGFPLALDARFDADDPALGKLWEMAFRTLRISAHETYMDSPYWEQLQYVGDTRITALLSYLMSNEDRLARQAIEGFDQSRTADGLTVSRHPSREVQYIPPYSLFWIGMVHDFWMYRDDPGFVRARLPGVRTVLDWFLARQRPDGLMGWAPFWAHVDPAAGGARQTEEGGSGAVTAQLAVALGEAADLEEALGDRRRGATFRERQRAAVKGLASLWDEQRGLLRDHPGATTYSHDVNILAILLRLMPSPKLIQNVIALGHEAPVRTREAGRLVPASLYFRFYLHRALHVLKQADAFLDLIKPWREMLGMGLTAFPEFSDPTRSDSHAWTAHPAFDFLTTVAGIRPDGPGFRRVRIEPHLGKLGRVEARIPHPRGPLEVSYRRSGKRIEAKVVLPPDTAGIMVWKGRTYPLAAGMTRTLSLPD